MQNNNIAVLGSLRGIAALSVCLYHFVCTVINFIDDSVALSIFSYGHYGVQIFFVVSGLVIPWSMWKAGYKIRNFFKFLLKRLIRLEPPYIASLTIAVLHTYFRSISPHYNGIDITPTAKQVFLHFGYMIPFFEGEQWIRPVYWTLAIEFQYYFAIALLFPLLCADNRILRFIFLGVFLTGPLMIAGNFLLFHTPVFLLGILLFLYFSAKIDKIELIVWLVLDTVAMAYFHDLPTIFFSLFAFGSIIMFRNFKSRIGDFLGEISYSLYLFHSLTGMILLNYFSHVVESPGLKFALIVVALGVTIFASYVIYRIIERPSKNISSKIKY